MPPSNWPKIRISPETRKLLDYHRGNQTRDEYIQQGIACMVGGEGVGMTQAAVSPSGKPPWVNPTPPPQTNANDTIQFQAETVTPQAKTADEQLREAEQQWAAYKQNHPRPVDNPA